MDNLGQSWTIVDNHHRDRELAKKLMSLLKRIPLNFIGQNDVFFPANHLLTINWRETFERLFMQYRFGYHRFIGEKASRDLTYSKYRDCIVQTENDNHIRLRSYAEY